MILKMSSSKLKAIHWDTKHIHDSKNIQVCAYWQWITQDSVTGMQDWVTVPR